MKYGVFIAALCAFFVARQAHAQAAIEMLKQSAEIREAAITAIGKTEAEVVINKVEGGGGKTTDQRVILERSGITAISGGKASVVLNQKK